MNYTDALNYLRDLNRFGMNLGLSRMERLLGYLGNPQRGLKCVHVAGTNGKGSTSAMLASILREAGYQAGLFTSPHLERYTERIRINDREIPEDAVAEGINRLRPLVERVSSEVGPTTEFEVTTALAIWYFAERCVDWAILEVGLGGDLDSTNLITPMVTVITNVSIDHADVLGQEVEAIASSKAGTVKPGVPVITAAVGRAEDIIEQRARELRAPVIKVKTAEESPVSGTAIITWRWKGPNGWGRSIIDVKGRLDDYPGLSLSLAGKHQGTNAAVAVAAVEALMEQGVAIDQGAIYRGLAATEWPGRLELMQAVPPIVVDGAHNLAGAESLVEALNDYYPNHHWHLVLGVLRDKDQRGIARVLARRARTVIITPPPSPRADDMRELIEECEQVCPRTFFEPDNYLALKRGVELLKEAGKDELESNRPSLLCVTGSLFLIGRARQYLFSLLKKD